jgi:hypothetical protein
LAVKVAFAPGLIGDVIETTCNDKAPIEVVVVRGVDVVVVGIVVLVVAVEVEVATAVGVVLGDVVVDGETVVEVVTTDWGFMLV